MSEIGVKAALFTTKNILIGCAVLAVLITLAVLGYKLFIAPVNAKHDIAAAHGTTAIAQGGTQSGAQATNIVSGNGKKSESTDTVTRTNYVYITKQPGAADPVNPALFDAFTRSVCLRVSAAGLPECDGLRKPGPEGLEEGDTERAAAGR